MIYSTFQIIYRIIIQKQTNSYTFQKLFEIFCENRK
jgi:hypothetical protein